MACTTKKRLRYSGYRDIRELLPASPTTNQHQVLHQALHQIHRLLVMVHEPADFLLSTGEIPRSFGLRMLRRHWHRRKTPPDEI
ncbi:hypothetical protein MGYG_07200 [Nannizzia gypsea CBS 118893]|uniref:Uncharacterized protein n=1 Tax=Arthroderma gypseum (strain ATCC MYA-4604 / CBS 118893) TaxID=535722 RepID=E4V2C8_ARTGP|nr:hypothetical protein MGYG_07200 [Nannizzia gypsea CBS 118893]EFR04193.1 hypothetical protein MGYG_07200 [Nannizzia gypsea CBS 118893]